MSLAALFFLLQIAAGTAAWTFVASLRSLGHGFYQLHVAIAFAALALGLVDDGHALAALLQAHGGADAIARHWPLAQRVATLVAGAFLLLAAFAYSWKPKLAVALHGLGAACCAALYLAALSLFGWTATWPAGDAAGAAFFVATGILGATVLGLALIAMNVGHWYLVNPRLSAAHLSRPTLLLFLALIARCLLLAAPAFATWRMADTEGLSSAGAFLRYGFFESARAIAGGLAPLGLAWMAVKTAEIRSTQAATGILYALLVLAAIGEGLAQFLVVSRRMPW